MSNYSKIYWLTRLDYLQDLFAWLIFFCVLCIVCYYAGSIDDSPFVDDVDEFKKHYRKKKNVSLVLALVFAMFLTFMPSKEDMIMIYAGGKTMDFVQSDSSINKIPAQTTKVISDYLDKKIKESENK